MKHSTIIRLSFCCFLVCILYSTINNINGQRTTSDHKTFKAGFFQNVVDFVVDLFDGDGNVNGTPGDPYNITLGKNGKHGGSWARDDHPFTIFNRHNGEVYWKTIDKIKAKVDTGYDYRDDKSNPNYKFYKYYTAPYQGIYNSANEPLNGNCGKLKEGICVNAKRSKNAAFVALMGFSATGIDISAYVQPFVDKAITGLESLGHRVPTSGPTRKIEKFYWHTKNLIMYMQAYDMLMAKGVPKEDLKKARKKLQKYATQLKNAAGWVFTTRGDNHTLMASGALGVSSIVLHESAGGFLGGSKNATTWDKKARKNVEDALFTGLEHKASDDVNAGYAEGPHYFQFGMSNCMPYFLASYNYALNKNSHHVDYYHDGDVLNLFKWFEGIKMPDGELPPFDDTYLGKRKEAT